MDTTPNKLYWHEALDRASLAADFFSDNVEAHPAVQNDAELKEFAEDMTTRLSLFYQIVGMKAREFDLSCVNSAEGK